VTKPIRDEDLMADADADTGVSLSAAGGETGTQQAGAGSIGRQAVSAAENISDIGQAEAYIAQLKRLVAGEIDHTARIQRLAEQALANDVALSNLVNNNAALLANRQNQGGQATTERINAIQENSLQFDNEGPLLAAIRNPVFLDAIAVRVVEALQEKDTP
jgi:hypothetical protein